LLRGRHREHVGDPGEPPGADPVHAALVFLHLLEGDADRIGKLGLRHAAQQPLRADPAADLDVLRLGRPRVRISSPLPHGAFRDPRRSASGGAPSCAPAAQYATFAAGGLCRTRRNVG